MVTREREKSAAELGGETPKWGLVGGFENPGGKN